MRDLRCTCTFVEIGGIVDHHRLNFQQALPRHIIYYIPFTCFVFFLEKKLTPLYYFVNKYLSINRAQQLCPI